MPIHKILHLIGPIIVFGYSIKVFKLSTVKAIAITLLLGLSKEIYDVIIIGDSLISSVLDMIGNILGTVIGIQIFRTYNHAMVRKKFSIPFIRQR